MMRVSSAEYLGLRLRTHEFLSGVPLYDVSAVDLPGGGVGRSLADIQSIESTGSPSLIATVLYGVRHFLGRVFGWDRDSIDTARSFLSKLSERDRSDSEVVPGTRDGSFSILYQFPTEALREAINGTVHGFICSVLTNSHHGYRLYWAVYVLPVSWLTRPYLAAIEPFRWILYPAMLRRIRRAWIATYGDAVTVPGSDGPRQ